MIGLALHWRYGAPPAWTVRGVYADGLSAVFRHVGLDDLSSKFSRIGTIYGAGSDCIKYSNDFTEKDWEAIDRRLLGMNGVSRYSYWTGGEGRWVYFIAGSGEGGNLQSAIGELTGKTPQE